MEKKVRFLENYQNKVPSTFMEEKQTGIPLTSYVSEKFLDADKFRSPYDLHWMKVYDSNNIVENFYSGIGPPHNCKCNPSNILIGNSECSNCQNPEDNGKYMVEYNIWKQV